MYEISPEKMQQSVAMLTAEELFSLVRQAVNAGSSNPVPNEPRYVKGRKELSLRLGVSLPTIIKWEDKGIIKKHSQIGRVITYDLHQCRENQKNSKNA